MNKQQEVVMYDDPNIVKYTTVEGWVGKNGRFYGKDEDLARHANSTHRRCKTCSAVIENYTTLCSVCESKYYRERFEKFPVQEWNGNPLCLYVRLYSSDRWFGDLDELQEYLQENELSFDDVMVVQSEGICAPEIELEYVYEDILPDDGDYYAIPEELREIIEQYNEKAVELQQNKRYLSYQPVDVRLANPFTK